MNLLIIREWKYPLMLSSFHIFCLARAFGDKIFELSPYEVIVLSRVLLGGGFVDRGDK